VQADGQCRDIDENPLTTTTQAGNGPMATDTTTLNVRDRPAGSANGYAADSPAATHSHGYDGAG
jgi:hypothetical protein